MAKMVTCKTCGAQIAKTAKTCPHCGASRGGGFFKFLFKLLLTLTFIAVLFIVGSYLYFTNQEQYDATIEKTTSIFTSHNKLEEVDPPSIGKGEFGTKAVVGTYKNVSGSKISYAQVTFALFDGDGAQIGTAVANINDLAKDAVWKYSATPLTMEKWTSFELTDITTW